MLKNKMLFISITLAIVIGCIIWKFTIENLDLNDVEIPKSANINYNQQPPIALNVDLINKEFKSVPAVEDTDCAEAADDPVLGVAGGVAKLPNKATMLPKLFAIVVELVLGSISGRLFPSGNAFSNIILSVMLLLKSIIVLF